MREYDNTDEYNNLIDKLEEMPQFEINADDKDSLRYSCLASIAISLKRIADIMQGKQQPVIMSAEEYARYKTDLEKDGNVRP